MMPIPAKLSNVPKCRLFLRYLVAFFAFVSLLTSSLFAQDNRFEIDVHAGLAGSQVQGDGLGGFDKLSAMAGLGITASLARKLNIGFELNLTQKGSVLRPNPDVARAVQYKMTLWYAQVPILLQYNQSEKLSFLAGPALATLLTSKEEDINGEIGNNPDFKPFELSVILAGMYRLGEHLSAQLRLDQSILSIRTKGDGSFNRLIGRQYNTVLGAYLAYTF